MQFANSKDWQQIMSFMRLNTIRHRRHPQVARLHTVSPF
jgi:hypothetical protein